MVWEWDGNPLAVAALSRTVDEEIDLEGLRPHLVSDPGRPDLTVFHCRWQYRPWDADWALCLPHRLVETPDPGALPRPHRDAHRARRDDRRRRRPRRAVARDDRAERAHLPSGAGQRRHGRRRDAGAPLPGAGRPAHPLFVPPGARPRAPRHRLPALAHAPRGDRPDGRRALRGDDRGTGAPQGHRDLPRRTADRPRGGPGAARHRPRPGGVARGCGQRRDRLGGPRRRGAVRRADAVHRPVRPLPRVPQRRRPARHARRRDGGGGPRGARPPDRGPRVGAVRAPHLRRAGVLVGARDRPLRGAPRPGDRAGPRPRRRPLGAHVRPPAALDGRHHDAWPTSPTRPGCPRTPSGRTSPASRRPAWCASTPSPMPRAPISGSAPLR